jgi:putative endonuclease
LIIRKEHLVAFVEVKTRCSLAFGSGLQAVNRRKQRDIIRVAGLWVDRFGRTDDHYRFDLIAVQGITGGTPAIEHVPDAWRAVGHWAY